MSGQRLCSSFQVCILQVLQMDLTVLLVLHWSGSTLVYVATRGSQPIRMHLLLSMEYLPLDGISAGLSLPGQCFQCCGATRLLIVFTLFSTNCFHLWSKPCIQNKDTFESVKQIGSSRSSCDCRADFTLLASFDNRRADNNSNRGIVRPLIGATRVFAERNLT